MVTPMATSQHAARRGEIVLPAGAAPPWRPQRGLAEPVSTSPTPRRGGVLGNQVRRPVDGAGESRTGGIFPEFIR